MRDQRNPTTTDDEATDAALQRLIDLGLVQVSNEPDVGQCFRISDQYTGRSCAS
jgi:hypothetical protein